MGKIIGIDLGTTNSYQTFHGRKLGPGTERNRPYAL